MIAEKANNDSKQLESLIDETKQVNFVHIYPKPLNISNIVVSTKININIASSFDNFKEYSEKHPMGEDIHLSKKSLGRSCIIYKWNQKYENEKIKSKNISVKVFKNGSLHITGVTFPDEAVIISECIRDYIKLYENTILCSESPEEEEDEEKIHSYNLIMIQSTFDLGVTINLPKLLELWNIEDTFAITNDKHSAIQIKYQKNKTSTFIFSTGKILITGCKNSTQLQSAHKNVCDFFENNFDKEMYHKKEDLVKIPKKRGRKSKMELDALYNSKKIHLV